MAAPRDTWVDTVFFVAVLATALAMGAALAHALEFPNKMVLSREEYFTVQKIYEGWDRLAYLLAVQLLALLTLLFLVRSMGWVRGYVLGALLGLAAAQAVFWIFTFPANQVTAGWTIQPENWAQLRRQWEYSHVAGALCQFASLSLLTAALIAYAHRESVMPLKEQL